MTIECPSCGAEWTEEDYRADRRDQLHGCSKCIYRHYTMALTLKRQRFEDDRYGRNNYLRPGNK